MAATDVLPSSPMSPGQTGPWSSFEDYLDFPSPLATPRLAPLSAIPSFSQVSQPMVQQPSQVNAVPSTQLTSNAPPPPPGSSPEILFVSLDRGKQKDGMRISDSHSLFRSYFFLEVLSCC